MTDMIFRFLFQAVGPPTTGEAKNALSVILDIAAIIGALAWPIFLFLIFLAYRDLIPPVLTSILGRISKVGFGGFSIELAKATEFAPDWSGSSTTFDLRNRAAAIKVNDSTAQTFLTQLREKGDGDYAEVDLGCGSEWLTSRLFITAIVFARLKGIKSFVFLETAGTVRKRFVCWATPESIRWALARRFPWLEQAYARAYVELMAPPPPLNPGAYIASERGALGFNFSQTDPGPSFELFKKFLEKSQIVGPPPDPNDADNWVLVDDDLQTFEHAHWLNAALLEDLLDKSCSRSKISAVELRSKSAVEQQRIFLSISDRYVAVTDDEQRFEYLVDRSVILEQLVR